MFLKNKHLMDKISPQDIFVCNLTQNIFKKEHYSAHFFVNESKLNYSSCFCPKYYFFFRYIHTNLHKCKFLFN